MKLTKAEVVSYCRSVFREHPDCYRGDAIAQREFFNDYTDLLCKAQRITTRQYETWDNPF